MDNEREQLVSRVKAYLEHKDKSPFKLTTTVRGYLELRTEQIRVLLDALCDYQSSDEEKMKFRDELLRAFFAF